jgi:hypothetical protein
MVHKIKTRKIAPGNLPSKMPLWPCLIIYLLLDKFDPAGWVWGAVGLFCVMWIVGSTISAFQEDWCDIFKKGE